MSKLFSHITTSDIHTRHAVDDDESTVRDTQGSGHLRREVNVAGGVDEVDEERRQTFFTGLLDQGEILLWQGVIQRDSTATYNQMYL